MEAGQEILNQVKITRELCDGAAGTVHWSIKAFGKPRANLGPALATNVYSDLALIPPSPWLDERFPAKPKLHIESGKLKWKPAGFEKINLWLLQTKIGGEWQTTVLPGDSRENKLSALSTRKSLPSP